MSFPLCLLAGSLIYACFKIDRDGEITNETVAYLISISIICIIIYIFGG